MTRDEQLEYLALLEEQNRRLAYNDLNEYCRAIEIPGAPLLADSCPLGDDCDDPKCTGHEISNAFYPETVEPAIHHELINNTLMKVEAKEVCPDTGNIFNRVMVFMPPGSAKSTYGTVVFPTWFMGRNPRKNIITTSYASGLAKKFGRKCRTITSSTKYDEIFNAQLKTDNRAVDDWALTNESTFMCGGILSGITGNRADGLVIDDPVKGREDADSPTIREKTWEAYLNDLRTRLKPGGFILIIQTRWHEQDLSGLILPDDWDGQSGWVEAKDGEPWYVICLQAQCEREDDPLGREIGQWLWTDWFSPEHWERERRVQGSRNWDALYMQRPKPADGALIKRAWPMRYGEKPAAFLRVIFSLDTAYKASQVNDPSVLTVWGERDDGYYLLHVWRERVGLPELKKALANLYLQWKPDGVLIEDKASGQSLIQECQAGIEIEGWNRKLIIPTIAIEPEGDKLTRLVAVSPLIEAGLLWLPNIASWLTTFESELFGFPLTTHDDQVDSVSQFLRWAHAQRVNLTHYRSNNKRAALADENNQSHTDTNKGYGAVRSRNNFNGY
ncbi:hypothetical protein tloyanaT_13320 [Thalassotalea loyana]|uniref:Terminase large subunit gp17-like C-terminal domain-containing protein n=1 Tax=Thalassotalea loyana TaxID=280483 RepID=A0ABQ6HAD2_9GAMM|nr:phage terminase large subunit [Thalassotalea loyana]GLX85080.1 hypothetical protein tloyanaT_13320 [Thalassotalea loyana]